MSNADAAAIKLIGTKALTEHFGVGASTVSQWKKRGIPPVCRNPLILFGETLGHDMSDLKSGHQA